MNVNKVILVGRLTRDPEVRTTPGGQTVATVGVATNDYWTDKNGQRQERTEFHTVVLWGRSAEIAGQYLTKGQEAYFEGRLQSRTYTDKAGVERKVTDIVATSMQLGSRPQGAGAAPSGAARPAMNRPQQAMGAASQVAPKQETPIEEIPTINLDDEKEDVRIEDVPF